LESFYLIIPIALIFCVVAIKAFFWAVDHRQFDDLENEGKRILFDDDDSLSPQSTDEKSTSNSNKLP
jgi:cbb3-type cytochrome oxidase maturation protein